MDNNDNIKTLLPAVQGDMSNAMAAFGQKAERGQVVFAKFKKGDWLSGRDETPMQEGAQYAVRPGSICSGFIAFNDGAVVAEKMRPITEGPVNINEMPPLPPDCKDGYSEAASLDLLCVFGDDEGVSFRFSTSSMGGTKAVAQLAKEWAKNFPRMEQGEAHAAYTTRLNESFCIPVIELDASSFTSKKYGVIATPVLRVVDWLNGKGERLSEQSGESAAAAPAPAAAGAPAGASVAAAAAATRAPARAARASATAAPQATPPAQHRARTVVAPASSQATPPATRRPAARR